jgi:hypothetical protein
MRLDSNSRAGIAAGGRAVRRARASQRRSVTSPLVNARAVSPCVYRKRNPHWFVEGITYRQRTMVALLCFALAVLASPFKARSRLEAENAVLRHQLNVLRRKVRGRAPLTNNDRWFFIRLYRWFPSILQVLAVVRP